MDVSVFAIDFYVFPYNNFVIELKTWVIMG